MECLCVYGIFKYAKRYRMHIIYKNTENIQNIIRIAIPRRWDKSLSRFHSLGTFL